MSFKAKRPCLLDFAEVRRLLSQTYKIAIELNNLIGIYPKAISSGRRTVAKYLVDELGFTQVYLAEDGRTPDQAEKKLQSFASAEDLLNFVTKKWQQHWVLLDVANERLLDALSRRPFFILVSVDAPLSLRWNRFKEK